MLAMRSGQKLAVEIRQPRGPVLGTAILLHAAMASRRVWSLPRDDGFAATLNDAGLRTLALDFRGHGESRPTASRGASFTYDELVNEDIPALCHAARERWPSHRVTLVGHSLGGHAAIASVGTGACTPDALVALAANVWLPSDEPNPVLCMKKAALAQSCRLMARTVGYFPARALGLGSDDESLPLIESWVAWWTQNRWTGSAGSVDYGAAMSRVVVPVLGIASLGDRLYCTPGCAARFFKRLGSASATFELLRRGDDGGPAPDHMQMLTTRAAVSCWRRVALFCAGR
jgi:predicted alpha/beta hydrolase